MISEYKTSVFLAAKTQAFADLHSYRLAVQSTSFEPVASETYLQEAILPNDNDQLGIGYDSSVMQLPIYQIDVYTPKGQGGKFSGQKIGDLLVVEFKRGPIIFNDGAQTIQITNSSSATGSQNDTHNRTMVTVELTILATNT